MSKSSVNLKDKNVIYPDSMIVWAISGDNAQS